MKILKYIITSLSILSLIFFANTSNINADNNGKENILEVIRNNDFLDIKKIEFDENNRVIKSSIEDVKIDTKSINITNGSYLIHRGTGWVLANDKSFVKSGFAGPGELVRILEGKSSNLDHSIMLGAAAEFGPEIVKVAIELTYERKISQSKTIMTGVEITAPSDKNIYVKTYTTYNRYDLIKVIDNKVVGHSITYEPEGSWSKYVAYGRNEIVDQGALKERVDRCVLGDTGEIKINNSINIKGSSYANILDILIDSNTNVLRLANRNNTRIHPGTGNNEYFKIDLLDSNYKIKSSFSMDGNDYSNNVKYNTFDGTEYNIGDIIKIYHKEPFLLNIKGKVLGSVYNSDTQYYKITNDGLESLSINDTNNYINVRGNNYIKSLDIVINHRNKILQIINRNVSPIHQRTGNNEYFRIDLLDYNYNTKASLSMNGLDNSYNAKYNTFDGTEYNIGDIIKIYHKEPFLLSIKGNISGNVGNRNEQYYKITEGGIEVIQDTIISNGVYKIALSSDISQLMILGPGNNIVMYPPNKNMHQDYLNWEFIQIQGTNEFKIKNKRMNEFLTSRDGIKMTTTGQEFYDGSQSWRIEKLSPFEFNIVNSKHNLAIEKIYGVDELKLKPYDGSSNQKFKLLRVN